MKLFPLLLLFSISGELFAAQFRAGAAAVDITPTNLPIRTAGNLTMTVVNRVHDPLHARALVLDDGAIQLVIATVDSCMIAREHLDEAKNKASVVTGIPASHMLISATHTHTAPAVYGCHGNDPELEYRAWLITQITEGIVRAWKNRQPARVGWGKRDFPTFVYCRRWIMQPGTAENPNAAFTGQLTNIAMMNPGAHNPNKVRQTGPVDPAFTVLSVETPAGKPIAIFANYSTHYANAPSQEISADYFGEFCRLLADDLKPRNPEFVALMSNGTSGDANCSDFTKTNWTVNPALVAQAAVATANLVLAEMKYQPWVRLSAAEKRVRFNVRLPSREQVALARDYLATKVGNRPTRTWEENYARETVLLADWPETSEIILQALGVGDLGIGAIPCETFGSTGLKVKRDSPFPLTLVVGLANGYHGYLPPPDQFPLGGYTTWRARTSYLETNAEPRISETVIGLLKQIQPQLRR